MEIRLSVNQKIVVNHSRDIYLIMRQILRRENKIGRGREHFWMVGLNQANKILYIELVALGSSNMTTIKPREAFRMAIYKLAVRVIMVHNHPSGDVTPSDNDQDLTDHFIQAGKFLKVEVIDHLIVCDEGYESLADSGLFAKLQESKRWVLPYLLEKRARKEGKEEGLLEMARALKQKGISPTIIAETSGFSIEEIERL